MKNYLINSRKIYKVFIILSLATIFSFNEGYGQVTILPLGDSITKGIEDNGDAPADSGYRSFLYKKLELNSYSVNFVGDSLNPKVPATPDYDRYHQGLAGLRVNGNAIGGYPGPPLVDSVGNYLRRYPADIVLLHMGTNDITNPAGQSTEPIKTGIGTVLDSIHAAATDAIVILARIINRDSTVAQSFIDSTTALNIQLQDFDSLSYVYVVDMESALDYSTDMANGSHPNSSGYEKMANVWYDQITYIIDYVLPVELTSFTGTLMKDGVLLRWNTATELNNYGFEIERVSNLSSEEWNKIGFIMGSGNSNSPKVYSFYDKNLTGSGSLYYRLKQIDIDGKYDYSQVIEVELSPNDFELKQNYPNPFNPTTTIEYYISEKEFVNLSIFNSLGEQVTTLVNMVQAEGKYQIEFNAENLSSGIYYYKIAAGSNFDIKKLVLLK
ncbi:MAG: T9SS type A sorting domain-containing protein [Ignavibacteriae bacterium]|nr:T9SS C-terminal target domain-containing protein [Ignavibacteriota bacterium]NOH00343.1 T9SS type A sorting domain-containing protein [Ignavibacteriota bacterium]